MMTMSLIIFLTALGVRLLSWQDTRREVWKVQTGVVQDYRRVAHLLLAGGAGSFFSQTSPLSDPNTLGHPPGYSILLAIIFRMFGESDAAVQLVQILCDALAAVILFLIAAEALSNNVALIAGLLVALAPQFAWNSVLLLPDSLAALPILLAVYLLARATTRQPRLTLFLAAGALVGVSCWLRANVMILAPFLSLATLILFERGRRLRYAATILCGALIIIVPLTIRNAIVFRHFIPLSLGAGQTLLEGIADYDPQHKFGIPSTDMGILKSEAEIYQRPDYNDSLFGADGVKRERLRLARGFAVIRSHPLWFTSVMIRRAASMLRLERVRLISTEPPVTHALNIAEERQATWLNPPAELIANSAIVSAQAKVSLSNDEQLLSLIGDDSNYGDQFISPPIPVQRDTDFVLTLPIRIAQGRVKISVMDEKRRNMYASNIIETLEDKTPEEQPLKMIHLPFVNEGADRVRFVLSNEATGQVRPVIQIGTIKLFALGPASHLWTHYPRMLIQGAQKLFLTALMLPLAIVGIMLLARARRGHALVLLLVVPAYYLCVQSLIHTEYRYILVIYYFLFALVAVTLSNIGHMLWQRLPKVRPAPD